jgi:bacteriocin biosynthesis cyclodehydratase domain-containing protein
MTEPAASSTRSSIGSLPAMLRLPPHRSLLPHGPRSRLIGLDPAVALAVDELPHPLAAMLDELVDSAPTARLVGRAVDRGADPAAAQELLSELVAAGAVIDAAGPGRRVHRREQSTVIVQGAGPLTVGVALGLAAAGVGALHVVTSGSVLAADLGTGLVDADRGRGRAAAIAAALERLCPGASAGPPPQRVAADLVVLADAGVPDPVRIAELHAAGSAHLAVRLRDGIGVVGPLVLPGRTTCLGCLEVQRCAADPAWPSTAAHLVGTPGRAEPECAVATAGLATAQALRALDGAVGASGPPTLDATLELDVHSGTVLRRVWEPQPGCGCGAAPGGMSHGPAACADRGARDTIDE